MPWLEWRNAPAPPKDAVFTIERTFAQDRPAGTPRALADIALTGQAGRPVRFREQVGKVVLVNFITTRCTTARVQATRGTPTAATAAD